MKSLKCTVKGCNYRHPKTCKWFSKEVGCRRNDCEFLHGTLAKSDDKISAHKESSFKCEGCRGTFENKEYVVKPIIKSKEMFFCLNCDDWIGNKEEVLKSDWTLFDSNGDLRRDV